MGNKKTKRGKRKFRVENDSLGKKKIPVEAYYGIQTLRAVENFEISSAKTPSEIIYAIAEIKSAAARANADLKVLSKKISNAIIKASKEIVAGKFDEHFVVDAYQAGAGTSSHMNVNEVIANRANEILGSERGTYVPIHPNDHVNYGQSTNDVFPTAMRIASLRLLKGVLDETEKLSDSLRKKEKEFRDVVKSGRTHLQDAVPMTLGNEFGAYAQNVERWHYNISLCVPSLQELGIGGSAVGSGINTAEGYKKLVVKYLAQETGLKLKSAKNLFEAMQSMSPFLQLSSSLKNYAIDLSRICNDLRLMSSGPATGLNEINLPPVQPGSSIMPGKVNPVIAEAMNMVCYQVIGNDTAISYASQAGQLELNVMMPLIAFNIVNSLKILAAGLKMFREKCIVGISANKGICRFYAERSEGIATALNRYIGYSRAAEIVKLAKRSKKSVIDIIREKKILTEKEIEKLLST
ncbi:MAG: aspartate ammonia-lyase [Candidatus Schekmanbacteria bacterium]|nr:MAG: aspartate ammonia-lyase [Candidatus Schekmanbacteria bacterium]